MNLGVVAVPSGISSALVTKALLRSSAFSGGNNLALAGATIAKCLQTTSTFVAGETKTLLNLNGKGILGFAVVGSTVGSTLTFSFYIDGVLIHTASGFANANTSDTILGFVGTDSVSNITGLTRQDIYFSSNCSIQVTSSAASTITLATQGELF